MRARLMPMNESEAPSPQCFIEGTTPEGTSDRRLQNHRHSSKTTTRRRAPVLSIEVHHRQHRSPRNAKPESIWCPVQVTLTYTMRWLKSKAPRDAAVQGRSERGEAEKQQKKSTHKQKHNSFFQRIDAHKEALDSKTVRLAFPSKESIHLSSQRQIESTKTGKQKFHEIGLVVQKKVIQPKLGMSLSDIVLPSLQSATSSSNTQGKGRVPSWQTALEPQTPHEDHIPMNISDPPRVASTPRRVQTHNKRELSEIQTIDASPMIYKS